MNRNLQVHIHICMKKVKVMEIMKTNIDLTHTCHCYYHCFSGGLRTPPEPPQPRPVRPYLGRRGFARFPQTSHPM